MSPDATHNGTATSPPGAAAAALRLQLTGISKQYPAVRANDRVALRVMPGQIHAVLGENAANLSGGQRARLALAAALLAGRPVLVLDEPFANIDDASRHVILATLEQTRADRLCIAITHERSLLAIADRALRLEDGGLTAITASAHADATATNHPVMEVLHARA